MKRILLLGLTQSCIFSFGQIGIGTINPNQSSLLDVDIGNLSANGKKGLLISQVTLTATLGVSIKPNPANGLLIYNTSNA